MRELQQTPKCSNCGAGLTITSETDINTVYTCLRCGKKYFVSKNISQNSRTTVTQLDYRAARNLVSLDIDRLVSGHFTPHQCCGSNKFDITCDLQDGFKYTCKKCQEVQVDQKYKKGA